MLVVSEESFQEYQVIVIVGTNECLCRLVFTYKIFPLEYIKFSSGTHVKWGKYDLIVNDQVCMTVVLVFHGIPHFNEV